MDNLDAPARESFRAVRMAVHVWTLEFSAADLVDIADVVSAHGGDVDLNASTHVQVLVVIPETLVDAFGDAVEALDNVSRADVVA